VAEYKSVIVTVQKHHSGHQARSAGQGIPTLVPAVMARAAKTQQYTTITTKIGMKNKE